VLIRKLSLEVRLKPGVIAILRRLYHRIWGLILVCMEFNRLEHLMSLLTKLIPEDLFINNVWCSIDLGPQVSE